ncbi:hypothetical protein RCL1_002154 [Eukaryota sp. TZLM3-RCL]
MNPNSGEPPVKKPRTSGSRSDYTFSFIFQLSLMDLEFHQCSGSAPIAMKSFFECAFGIYSDKFVVNGAEMNLRTQYVKLLRDIINFCAGHPSFASLETLVILRQDKKDSAPYHIVYRTAVPEDELRDFICQHVPDFDRSTPFVYYDDDMAVLEAQKQVQSMNSSTPTNGTPENVEEAESHKKKKTNNYSFWFLWKNSADDQLKTTSIKGNGPPAVKKFFKDAFALDFGKRVELQGQPYTVKSNNLQYLKDFCSFASLYEPFNNLDTFYIMRGHSDTISVMGFIYRNETTTEEQIREALLSAGFPHEQPIYASNGELTETSLKLSQEKTEDEDTETLESSVESS